MKKILALLMSVIMMVTLFPTAFVSGAEEAKSQYPIVVLHGNANDIYDQNGKQVYDFDYDTSNLLDDVVEVCMPALLEGIATGDYSNYFDKLYQKLSVIYGDAKLDTNGNPLGGTDIQKSDRDYMVNHKNLDTAEEKGYYDLGDYSFWFDWRLDPFEIADELNEYINAILETTGKEKVSIYSRCLGGIPVMAYVSEYGSDKIDTLAFNSVVSNGCEKIDDLFTANLNLDPNHAYRFLTGYEKEATGDVLGGADIAEFLTATLKLLNATGVSKTILDDFQNTVYDTLGAGVISAFTRAGYATWPSYWAMVRPENYEKAKTVIFGDENDERRAEYAGLIEKLDLYQEKVASKTDELLISAKTNDTKICIISKYGLQLQPYYISANKIADEFLSLNWSSFGATTAPITERFSEEYVASRIEAGYGKYISVDKEVDASTCLFPEYTWFIKGLYHDNWIKESEELAYAVCSSTEQLTVDSLEKFPQFICYDSSTGKISPLTEENMDAAEYCNNDSGSTDGLTKHERIFKTVKVLIQWLKVFIKFVVGLFNK